MTKDWMNNIYNLEWLIIFVLNLLKQSGHPAALSS